MAGLAELGVIPGHLTRRSGQQGVRPPPLGWRTARCSCQYADKHPALADRHARRYRHAQARIRELEQRCRHPPCCEPARCSTSSPRPATERCRCRRSPRRSASPARRPRTSAPALTDLRMLTLGPEGYVLGHRLVELSGFYLAASDPIQRFNEYSPAARGRASSTPSTWPPSRGSRR